MLHIYVCSLTHGHASFCTISVFVFFFSTCVCVIARAHVLHQGLSVVPMLPCFHALPSQVGITEKLKVLDEIASDNDHREFVSAGVSAGISAAFGAPIGGVLFSMEEACSFWSRKTAWRCFLCATLSTFTIQLLNKRWACFPCTVVAAWG